MKAKFELNASQQEDELDLLRDKASKLLKTEQTLEKFQKKMLEMNELKKQVFFFFFFLC
jgi:hypothetical protein